jgi:hypothetical protein
VDGGVGGVGQPDIQGEFRKMFPQGAHIVGVSSVTGGEHFCRSKTFIRTVRGKHQDIHCLQDIPRCVGETRI